MAASGQRPRAVVRHCLTHSLTQAFIPLAEPWRNGVVEHSNDTFVKSNLRSERSTDTDRRFAHSAESPAFHNSGHRYSALWHPPDQALARAGFTTTPPDFTVAAPASTDTAAPSSTSGCLAPAPSCTSLTFII